MVMHNIYIAEAVEKIVQFRKSITIPHGMKINFQLDLIVDTIGI